MLRLIWGPTPPLACARFSSAHTSSPFGRILIFAVCLGLIPQRRGSDSEGQAVLTEQQRTDSVGKNWGRTWSQSRAKLANQLANNDEDANGTRKTRSSARCLAPGTRYAACGPDEIKGGTQIRTGDKGFAILCLTTWPCRRLGANSQLRIVSAMACPTDSWS